MPDAVVATISRRAGSAVGACDGSAFGFSPGFAGIARLADGSRLFLKVMSASRGARWVDLAGYLPSFETHGGGRAAEAFRAHPLSRGVSRYQERALVTALAGYFTVQSTAPAVPALPGLREFQRAQAIPALNWLRELAD